MTRIGILSDTHGYLDPSLKDFFADCDEIWHCGDFGCIEVANELRLWKPLRGVAGNIDGLDVRCEFRNEELFMCEGLKVFIRHIGGYPKRYDPIAYALLQQYKPDLFVCGHSHILKVMNDPNMHFLMINPGAAGISGFHPIRTAVRFSIDNKTPKDMQVWKKEKKL